MGPVLAKDGPVCGVTGISVLYYAEATDIHEASCGLTVAELLVESFSTLVWVQNTHPQTKHSHQRL